MMALNHISKSNSTTTSEESVPQLLSHMKLLHPGAARASICSSRSARSCMKPHSGTASCWGRAGARKAAPGSGRLPAHTACIQQLRGRVAVGEGVRRRLLRPPRGGACLCPCSSGTAQQPNYKGGRVRVAALHLEHLRAARGLTRVRLGADGEVHVPKPKHGLTDTVGLARRPVQHTVRQRPGEGGQVRGRRPSWTPPQRPDLASSMATCKLFSPPRRVGAARVSCRRTVQREWPVAGREDTAGAQRKCPVAHEATRMACSGAAARR